MEEKNSLGNNSNPKSLPSNNSLGSGHPSGVEMGSTLIPAAWNQRSPSQQNLDDLKGPSTPRETPMPASKSTGPGLPQKGPSLTLSDYSGRQNANLNSQSKGPPGIFDEPEFGEPFVPITHFPAGKISTFNEFGQEIPDSDRYSHIFESCEVGEETPTSTNLSAHLQSSGSDNRKSMSDINRFNTSNSKADSPSNRVLPEAAIKETEQEEDRLVDDFSINRADTKDFHRPINIFEDNPSDSSKNILLRLHSDDEVSKAKFTYIIDANKNKPAPELKKEAQKAPPSSFVKSEIPSAVVESFVESNFYQEKSQSIQESSESGTSESHKLSGLKELNQNIWAAEQVLDSQFQQQSSTDVRGETMPSEHAGNENLLVSEILDDVERPTNSFFDQYGTILRNPDDLMRDKKFHNKTYYRLFKVGGGKAVVPYMLKLTSHFNLPTVRQALKIHKDSIIEHYNEVYGEDLVSSDFVGQEVDFNEQAIRIKEVLSKIQDDDVKLIRIKRDIQDLLEKAHSQEKWDSTQIRKTLQPPEIPCIPHSSPQKDKKKANLARLLTSRLKHLLLQPTGESSVPAARPVPVASKERDYIDSGASLGLDPARLQQAYQQVLSHRLNRAASDKRYLRVNCLLADYCRENQKEEQPISLDGLAKYLTEKDLPLDN